MDNDLKKKLSFLASKYEKSEFIIKDPSSFMHNYKDPVNQELAAFIAANLAFGRRDQILKHVALILDAAGSDIKKWILDGEYKKLFTLGPASFYRMYSHDSMVLFFDGLRSMLLSSPSIGEYIKDRWLEEGLKDSSLPKGHSGKPLLCFVISGLFSPDCNLIPHTKESSCKKLNMFLRWMVRDNSPVDLGLWNWYSKEDLLLPLDTHVMSEATNFGLIETTSSGKVQGATLKTCMRLTDCMREVFPDDPVKGDFALFGLGVDDER